MDRSFTRRALRFGLLGGVMVVYLSLVGMVETFNTINLVGGAVTLGRLLLVLPPFLVAYILVRPRVNAGVTITPSAVGAVLGGARAGLAAGVWTGAGRLIATALPEQRSSRNGFVAVSPSLLSVRTVGDPIGFDVILLAVL